MSLQCEYCGKDTNKVNIKRHQKSKACLDAQDKIIDYQPVSCIGCGINISREDRLLSHQKTCIPYQIHKAKKELREEYLSIEEELETSRAIVEELQEDIKELQVENKELRDTLAAKPININIDNRTTNNLILNRIENSVPISQKLLEDHAKKLTLNDILTAEDIADFVLSHPDIYISTSDYSRRKGKWLRDNPKKVYTDPEFQRLTLMVFKAINPKAQELMAEYLSMSEEQQLGWDHESKYRKLADDIRKESRGYESDIHRPFVKHIAKNTLAPTIENK